jgi:sphingomyelin phosphodiesterase
LTDPAAELSPAFWHNVTEVFINDDAAFQEYNARKTRGWKPPLCTGTCKRVEICQLRSPQSQYNCVNGAVNIPVSKKRDGTTDGWVQEEDCHHGLTSNFLARLKVRPRELRGLMDKYVALDAK